LNHGAGLLADLGLRPRIEPHNRNRGTKPDAKGPGAWRACRRPVEGGFDATPDSRSGLLPQSPTYELTSSLVRTPSAASRCSLSASPLAASPTSGRPVSTCSTTS
jgi:hypothetical protein